MLAFNNDPIRINGYITLSDDTLAALNAIGVHPKSVELDHFPHYAYRSFSIPAEHAHLFNYKHGDPANCAVVSLA